MEMDGWGRNQEYKDKQWISLLLALSGQRQQKFLMTAKVHLYESVSNTDPQGYHRRSVIK